MNTVEELKTDWARRKTTAGDMGILYFRETNKLYSTEMDNKSVQKKNGLRLILKNSFFFTVALIQQQK